MSKTITRTIVAHHIHGHINPGGEDEQTLDYASFFNNLRDASSEDRIFEYRDTTLAVTSYREIAGRHAFLFVAGNDSESVLTLDLNTATTSEVLPAEDRIFVQSRWVIVDPKLRIVVMESKRPTVSKREVEALLEAFAEHYLALGPVEITINQVASPTFAAEIESMTRIREASVVLNRPNTSWLEEADDLVHEVSESGASSIEVTARASRNQSLEKDQGIVSTILRYSRNRLSVLKNARVTGKTPHSPTEKTVSLERNSLKSAASVSKDGTPSKQLDQMGGAIHDIFDLAKPEKLQTVVPQE